MTTDRTRGDDRVQVLDADGQVVDGATVPALSDEAFVSIYRDMRFARHLDERLISLQRQGRLGTYSSLAGQEGSQIGSMYALDEADWVLYQYREHGAVVVRGRLAEYLQYWMGHESANAALADVNIAPLNITIGDHLPHAVGMAWASKLKGEDKAFVSHFGDGATSEGDFHEALNFAGVFDTPNVFVCNNNQWAISVPRERQTASATLAQKAEAYGFEGIQVDGMDPLAMYQVTKHAVEKARGETDDERRPTMIEAVQYRYGAHTTADDPSVYREEREVEEWKEKDPIPRLERFLRDTGRLDDERVDAIENEVEAGVAEAIETAEGSAEADPDDLFADAYAELPDRLRDQREYLRELRERHGDDALLDE